MAEYNERGQEIPDNQPVAVPLRRAVRSETARIKGLIREAMSEAASSKGMETFEESNDFDVGDNDDERLFSRYELSDMQEERPVSELTEKLAPVKLRDANNGNDEVNDDGKRKKKSDGADRNRADARPRESKNDRKNDARATRSGVESGDQEDSSEES